MKHLRAENGQGLVETAAVMALLLIIAVGAIDFAFIIRAHLAVVNAATVGATYAATSPSAANNLTAITAAALSETNNWQCTSVPDVTSAHGVDSSSGATISVTVSCEVANLIAFPSILNHVVASATVVRRVRS